MPLVSTVIPVYNGSNFMRRAIDSALAQTYANTEVLVINDGSTDGTEDIALSYGSKIRYFFKKNGGVSSALNLGIKNMKGEFFNWLSHDDVHSPLKVEKQMKAICKHGADAPVICVCNYTLINELGAVVSRSRADIGKYFFKSPLCFLGAEPNMMLAGDATLISKKVFETCGVFNEGLRASQETDMWLRCLNAAEFIFIPDYLTAYRVHRGQVSSVRRRAVGREAGAYRGSVIRETPLNETLSYYGDKESARRFGRSAFEYAASYFCEAAREMVKKIHMFFDVNWPFLTDVFEGMFEYADCEKICGLVRASRAEGAAKPEILVFLNEEISGNRAAAEFVAELVSPFNAVFVHCGPEDGFLTGGAALRLENDKFGFRPVYAALAALLLGVKMLWCNAEYAAFPANSPFSYLGQTDVIPLASYHCPNLNFSAASDLLFNRARAESGLPARALITCGPQNSAMTRLARPAGAIVMPPAGKAEAVVWWREFLACLLAREGRETSEGGAGLGESAPALTAKELRRKFSYVPPPPANGADMVSAKFFRQLRKFLIKQKGTALKQEAEIALLSARAAELEARVTAIYASRSWRVGNRIMRTLSAAAPRKIKKRPGGRNVN